MTDETKDQEQPESHDSGRSSSTLGAVRTTLSKRDSKGRPLGVYVILGIGVATLFVLMLVVYFWSADRDRTGPADLYLDHPPECPGSSP